MTAESAAAEARRRVREHRETAYHSTLPVFVSARVWRMDDDQLGFTHVRCGLWFGPYIDPQQTTEHAVAHDKGCEAKR